MDHPSPNWDKILVESCITLLQCIWHDQNMHIHGTSKIEASTKLRERILSRVTKLYTHPPKLHKCFPKITSIPLNVRLKRNTTNLQRWLARISHQQHVSRILQSTQSSGQLSLLHAYKCANINISERQKYPP